MIMTNNIESAILVYGYSFNTDNIYKHVCYFEHVGIKKGIASGRI